MFYAQYPIQGGGGVTSINGLSGAVTLVGTGGISIIVNSPSPGDITIDGSSLGSAGPSGSVQFSNGTGGFLADGTNFFWDNTNKRLGIDTNTPNVSLDVRGEISAIVSVTNTGANAALVSATSNTTVNGSNTTIGINGVAAGTVQVGAVNDKVVAGMNFSVTRGDTTDNGNLSDLVGANTLIFHNSGAAGTTDNVFGFSSTFFSEKGTATNLYDFFGQRVPAGTGVVTNHYGIYINSDSNTPVQNWLADHTQAGGTSFTAATNALEIAGALGFRNSGFQVSFVAPTLAASTPYVLPATDGANGDVLTTDGAGNLSFAPSSGGGANVFLSNLSSPTAINQDLIFNTGTLATLKTKDDVVATQTLTIASGSATVTGISGDLNLQTGTTTDTGSTTGAINLNTSAPGATDTNSGGVISATGDVTGTGQSGIYQFITGTAVDTLSGSFTAKSGGTTGAGASGTLNLSTGNANGTGSSGTVTISTGTAGSNSGDIDFDTGATTNPNFNSGNITTATGVVTGTGMSGSYEVITGDAEDNSSGTLFFGTGVILGAGSTGTARFGTGNVGSGTGSTGNVTIETGVVGAGAGTSGDVILNIGASTGTTGHIKFTDGSQGAAGYIWTSVDTLGSGSWMPPATLATNLKETFTLSGTDITNQYIDLSQQALVDSIIFIVRGGGIQMEGASYDYSVNYTGGGGGASRITFLNGLATGGGSALVAGDILQIQYEY